MVTAIIFGCKTTEINEASSGETASEARIHSSDEIASISNAMEALDFDKAITQLDQLKNQNDPSIQLLEAFCLEFGIGRPINSEKAHKLALMAALGMKKV